MDFCRRMDKFLSEFSDFHLSLLMNCYRHCRVASIQQQLSNTVQALVGVLSHAITRQQQSKGSCMNNTMLTALVSASLVLCLSLTSCARTKSDTASAAPAQSTSQSHAQSDFDKQRKDAEQQARPEIEKQRQEAQQEGEKSLDKDAISAIEETNKAVSAIAANKIDEARAAIERATGKIEILV